MKRFSITSLIAFFLTTLYTHAQIPQGYYSPAEGLAGEQLKTALHEIIKDHNEYPYTSSSTDTWDILKESDRDTANSDNVILFYSGWSINAAQEYNNAQGWSREHVWAKSHGDFGTDMGAGTDAHHLRPCDISVNSARSNLDFDIGGTIYVDKDGETECLKDGDSWEPRDAVKGDVARMLFYMAVRYEGENGEPDLELVDEVDTYDPSLDGIGYHGKLSTLLEWHTSDPVDSFEVNRNNVIYSYQENRNPFVDHPEYVEIIWSMDCLPPMLLNDTASTSTNQSIEINVLNNDQDSSSEIDYETLSVIVPPSHGSASIDTESRIIIYIPETSYSGQDILRYSVCSAGTTCIPMCSEAVVFITVENTTGINDGMANNLHFNVYPNPASDCVFIQYSGNEKAKCGVYTVNGEQIKRFALKGEYKLRTQKMKAGIYVLRVETKSGIINKQLVIHR